jgi:hypothetical protein
MADVWEDNPPSDAEMDVAETILYDMLRCVCDTCWDTRMRTKAEKQLNHPVFARQHQIAWKKEQERRRRFKQ